MRADPPRRGGREPRRGDRSCGERRSREPHSAGMDAGRHRQDAGAVLPRPRGSLPRGRRPPWPKLGVRAVPSGRDGPGSSRSPVSGSRAPIGLTHSSTFFFASIREKKAPYNAGLRPSRARARQGPERTAGDVRLRSSARHMPFAEPGHRASLGEPTGPPILAFSRVHAGLAFTSRPRQHREKKLRDKRVSVPYRRAAMQSGGASPPGALSRVVRHHVFGWSLATDRTRNTTRHPRGRGPWGGPPPDCAKRRAAYKLERPGPTKPGRPHRAFLVLDVRASYRLPGRARFADAVRRKRVRLR